MKTGTNLASTERPLLLICDPTHHYSRDFHDMLNSSGLDVRHVENANDCLAEIAAFSPQTVLVSADQRPGDMDILLKGLEQSPACIPELLLSGSSPSAELAGRWGFPIESCLQTPVDESKLADRLSHGGAADQAAVLERMEGVNSGTRQSPGLSSWDSEGGFIPEGKTRRS